MRNPTPRYAFYPSTRASKDGRGKFVAEVTKFKVGSPDGVVVWSERFNSRNVARREATFHAAYVAPVSI